MNLRTKVEKYITKALAFMSTVTKCFGEWRDLLNAIEYHRN